MVILFGARLAPGEVTIDIAYNATFSSPGGHGLQVGRCIDHSYENGEQWMAINPGREHARGMLPCFDDGHFPAIFRLTVRV